MNKHPLNKKIVNWIKNHVRPHFDWISQPDSTDDSHEENKDKIEEWKDKVKESIVFGVKIKWRF